MPEGLAEFENKDLKGKCLILDKSIYGLVQSARQYWKKLKLIMENLGFEIFGNDFCLLKRINEKGLVFIGLYVDDLMVMGDKEAVEQAVTDIKNISTSKEMKKKKANLLELPTPKRKMGF